MKNISKQLLAFGLAVQIFVFSGAAAQETISFEPDESTLTGRLLKNYVGLSSGEMLIGHILHLSEPITIVGNDNSQNGRSRRTVKNVQQVLVEFETDTPADDVMGDTVLLRGQLYNEPSGPHHTKVKMIVTELTVIAELKGEGPVATFKTHKE